MGKYHELASKFSESPSPMICYGVTVPMALLYFEVLEIKSFDGDSFEFYSTYLLFSKLIQKN